MIALREGAKELNHEHFHGGILEVAAKKKSDHFVSPWCGVVVTFANFVRLSTLPRRLVPFLSRMDIRERIGACTLCIKRLEWIAEMASITSISFSVALRFRLRCVSSCTICLMGSIH
jgi:hypothetical protein